MTVAAKVVAAQTAASRSTMPSSAASRALRLGLIAFALLCASGPILWLLLTSLKTQVDSISAETKVFPFGSLPLSFEPTFRAYRALTEPVAGTDHSFLHYLGSSVIIGALSTGAAVLLGTSCAYGFSRFRIPGAQHWLFFILSTRFLPPLAVVVPVLMMYRWFELESTHVGLILLYTSFNLSLSVWLMKGFIDEIPRAFEEAAVVDGYSRFGAFIRVILPEAATGMAVTAVFCLISAWNEFGFAMTLNHFSAQTVPTYFAGLQGNVEGVPWPEMAAGMVVFVAPIVVFVVLVRDHILRGVTFGTVKQ
jgi:multiple sugar transport system permease protein